MIACAAFAVLGVVLWTNVQVRAGFARIGPNSVPSLVEGRIQVQQNQCVEDEWECTNGRHRKVTTCRMEGESLEDFFARHDAAVEQAMKTCTPVPPAGK